MTSSFSDIRRYARTHKSLLALGSACLLAELAYAILNLSALPMYVEFSLNRGSEWGIILGAFLFAEAISRPPAGALGDRIGRKPLMIIGPAITAVSAYLTIITHGPYVIAGLMALRVLDGIGSGALWTSAFAAVGDIVGEKNRSAAMSVLNVTYMGGLALGFLMGGAANEMFGTYTASFYLVSMLLVMSALVMIIFLPRNLGMGHRPEPLHGEPLELPALEEPTEFKFTHLLRSFREVPDMVVLALVTFLGMGVLTPIVKLYAVEHLGMSETQFGILVAPVAGVMGVFAVPLGRLGDKYGKCSAVAYGILFSAIAMWVVALSRSIIVLGAAAVIIGLGFTVAFPAWNALVVSITSPDRRGEVLGAVGLAQGLAAIVGVALGSRMYHSDALSVPRLGIVNYNVPFWFSAALLSTGSVITFVWVCKLHAHREPMGFVTDRQRRNVVILAIIGLLGFGSWIGYRYTTPEPPDRVAWEWVKELVRDRPEKALRLANNDPTRGCDGYSTTKRAGKLYRSWRIHHQARYTVMMPDQVTQDRADVPVKFTFPGGKVVVQHIILEKFGSKQWKICRVTDK
ncbi:MAG: MFS transporter [Armatimonadota bacterium]|nr:MFS transporter [bacterium]